MIAASILKARGFHNIIDIAREYKSPKQDDQLTDNGTIGFWFCDLLPIAE